MTRRYRRAALVAAEDAKSSLAPDGWVAFLVSGLVVVVAAAVGALLGDVIGAVIGAVLGLLATAAAKVLIGLPRLVGSEASLRAAERRSEARRAGVTRYEIRPDGATDTFSAPYAYKPGTLAVSVDGIEQRCQELDPIEGAFRLGFVPLRGATIVVHWDVP